MFSSLLQINCVFLVITLKVLWTLEQQSLGQQVTKKETAKYSCSVFYLCYIYRCYRDLMKAIIVLVPLLGLTWIIGIISVNNETQAFAWIFAILNSLQVDIWLPNNM